MFASFFFSVVAIGKVRESAALKPNRGRKSNDREGGEEISK